ncbi:MAG: recombination regulator RecX [Bacteroidales bacterium]|nr:recombination regulator RecX [Bacteroidales bacterium]
MDVPVELLNKLERYCAYQERSEAEVRKKLGSLAASVAQGDEIIRLLKENDFLNENRFAEIFIRSKLKDHWGKLKIRQGLYQKGVTAEIINEQMSYIDDDAYNAMLQEAMDKWKRLNAKDADNRSKLIKSMLSKGYAMDEIMPLLKS